MVNEKEEVRCKQRGSCFIICCPHYKFHTFNDDKCGKTCAWATENGDTTCITNTERRELRREKAASR